MRNLPFLEEILADLRRFKECVEDNQDVDLDRDRFDLLVQLGLLERVQRSPARWMMTQAGEDAISQPAAGGPVAWADPADLVGDGYSHVFTVRSEQPCVSPPHVPLYTTPPAAANGDDAVLDVLKTAYESGYQDGQDAPNAYSDEKVKHRIALSLLEEMMADAAMRAQGDGEVK